MRGVPAEPEQHCPKRLVGRQDPALILGMRTRFIGEQEPRARHHAIGSGRQRRTGVVGGRDGGGQLRTRQATADSGLGDRNVKAKPI